MEKNFVNKQRITLPNFSQDRISNIFFIAHQLILVTASELHLRYLLYVTHTTCAASYRQIKCLTRMLQDSELLPKPFLTLFKMLSSQLTHPLLCYDASIIVIMPLCIPLHRLACLRTSQNALVLVSIPHTFWGVRWRSG